MIPALVTDLFKPNNTAYIELLCENNGKNSTLNCYLPGLITSTKDRNIAFNEVLITLQNSTNILNVNLVPFSAERSFYFKYFNINFIKVRNTTDNICKKYVLYSCISGNYDSLKDPVFYDPNFDYVFYVTTIKQNSNIWKIKHIDGKYVKMDNTRKCRMVKMKPYKYVPEYEISLYMDSHLNYNYNLTEFIQENIDSTHYLYVKRHPIRSNIFQEEKACELYVKDKEDLMKNQLESYVQNGFSEEINNKFGLIENGIMIRYHHNIDLIRLLKMWWFEVKTWSCRDQLSFNFAAWRVNASFKYFNDSSFFCARGHSSGEKGFQIEFDVVR